MAINQSSTFAGQFGDTFGQNGSSRQNRRDPATFWLNVGYKTVTQNADGEDEEIFVSLPYGIPLDTQEAYDLSKVKNANMRRLRTAQNALLEQVMDAAKTLDAGDEIILAEGKSGLCIQLRRVSADAAESASDDDMALVKPLKLVA